MKAVALICFSLLPWLYLAGCQPKKAEESKERFLVTTPIRLDTITTREYVCQIRAIQHIDLKALESGYLQHVYVDEGQFIQKGQIMFQILPIQYEAEYKKALAEANYVEIEYLNSKILADSNVISPTQLALVKAKWEKAKAELEMAKVRLGFMEIRAPFSGLMDKFYARLGSLLDQGDLLTTLSDISSLWVYFNVPEAEYLDYKQNMKNGNNMLNVRLKMANHQMYEYPGVVRAIEADFDNKTGNIAFRATFPNPEMLLRHGETGNVVITVPLKKALIIPQKATFEVLDKKYVFIVDKNNVLKPRIITIQAEIPDLYVVKDGLTDSDQILLEGLRKVKENDKITYEFVDPKTVLTNLKMQAQ